MNKTEFIEYLIDILVYPDEFKIDEFGYQCFYKDNKLYFRYNQESDTLWCSYKHIWNVFKEKCGLNNKEIKSLFKNMLLNTFNMRNTNISFS